MGYGTPPCGGEGGWCVMGCSVCVLFGVACYCDGILHDTHLLLQEEEEDGVVGRPTACKDTVVWRHRVLFSSLFCRGRSCVQAVCSSVFSSCVPLSSVVCPNNEQQVLTRLHQHVGC